MRSYALDNPWFSPPAMQYVAAFGNPPRSVAGLGPVKAADYTRGGWQPPGTTPHALSSKQVKAAMRRAKVTTRDVARASDLPMKRVKEIRDRGITGRVGVYEWLEIISRASFAKHLDDGVDVTPGRGYVFDAGSIFQGRARVMSKGGRRVGHNQEAYRRLLAQLDITKREDPGNAWLIERLEKGKRSIERALREDGIDPDNLRAQWAVLPPPPYSLPNPSDAELRELERMAAAGDPSAAARLQRGVERAGAATMASLGWQPGMRFEVHEAWPQGWPKHSQLSAGVWELTRIGTSRLPHVLQRVGRKGKVTTSSRNMRPVSPEDLDQALAAGLISYADDQAAPGPAPKHPSETTKAERKMLADAVQRALAPTYFRSLGEAVGRVFDTLETVGFELADHVGAPFWDQDGSWTWTGRVARQTADPFAPQAIEDAWLRLSFHKMPSGNVEATGYMTLSNPQHALPNPLLAVVGNPPRINADERGRRIERSMQAGGSLQDRIRYEAEMARRGQPVYDRIYLADALVRYGVIGEHESLPVYVDIAKAIRKLLKKRGIKNVSVRVPTDARSYYIGVRGTKKQGYRLDQAQQDALADLFGLPVSRDGVDLYPSHRERGTDWQTDYHHPAGPQLTWQNAVELADLIRGSVTVPEQWAPALGFQVGQVVKYAGKRNKRRYVVTGMYQYSEDGGRSYNLLALSGGPRGSSPSGVNEDKIELDADQSLPDQFAGYANAREAEPVAWRQVSVGVLPDGRTVVHAHYQRASEVSKAIRSAFGKRAVGMTGYGGTLDAQVYVLPEGLDSGEVTAALVQAGFVPSSPPSSVDEPRSVWLENPAGCPCYNARTGEVRVYRGTAAQATQAAAYEDNPHRPVPTIPLLNHVRTGDWCARAGALENPRDRKGEKMSLWWSRMLDTIQAALVQHPQQQSAAGIASLTREQWLNIFAPSKSKGARDKMWSDLLKWMKQQEAKGYGIRATKRPGWIDLNVSNTYDAAWLENQGTLHAGGQEREAELIRRHYSGFEQAGRLLSSEDAWDDLDYDVEAQDPEIDLETYRAELESLRQSRLAAGGGSGSVQGWESNPHERTWERPYEQDHSIDDFRDHEGFDAAWDDLVEFHGGEYEPDRVTVFEVDDGSDEETWAPMHAYLHELEDLTYTVPDTRSNKHQGVRPEEYPSSLRGEHNPGLWKHKFRGKVGAGRRAKLARPIVAKLGGAQALQIIPRGGGVSDWYHS